MAKIKPTGAGKMAVVGSIRDVETISPSGLYFLRGKKKKG